MVTKIVSVKDKMGIHARPAAKLTQIAVRCNSSVTLAVHGKRINPKLVLELMAASIAYGDEVKIICEGITEKEDLNKIVQFFECREADFK